MRLAGMDADRLARGEQVAGLQQCIDELEHGRVLGGVLEHGPASDQGIDPLRPLPFEVLASMNAKIEVGLQPPCCEKSCPSPDDVRSGQSLRRSPPAAFSGGELRPVIARPQRSSLQTPSPGEASPLNPDGPTSTIPAGRHKTACAEVP